MLSLGKTRKATTAALALSLALAALLTPARPIGAADHGDAPLASNDRSADLNDVYAFLDPTDNNRVVLVMTVHGFIVPAEAANFGIFDPGLRYQFILETTGDARVDHTIDVTFTEKTGAAANPQTATITSTFFPAFTAPTTVANLNPTGPAPVITSPPSSNIQFFAGLADDPFTFDIAGFNRFVASVMAGTPNPAALQRGRDSFAGYNTLAIAISLPVALIRSTFPRASLNTLGVGITSARIIQSAVRRPGRFPNPRSYVVVDRMGNPAVNVSLIPFARKNEYNLATTEDDAAGRFAADIVGTLTRLGTNMTNIGILANVAVLNGDFLRLDLTKANSGPGSGNNAGAGFPNGRRLGDDVVDTLLFFIANQNPLSDNANTLDVPLRDAFPVLGASQQPRDSGVDDNTRN